MAILRNNTIVYQTDKRYADEASVCLSFLSNPNTTVCLPDAWQMEKYWSGRNATLFKTEETM